MVMQRLAISALLGLCMLAFCKTVAAGQPASFYDALKSDTSHKLIAQAVDADPKTKAMLQKALPVTAFVPTDAAFVVAGIKYKLGTSPADLKKFMSNTCLINAVLKQHIIAGVYDTAALKTMSSKPSMLVTQQYDTQQHKMVKAAWPLKFKTNTAGAVTLMSAAVDRNNQPLINAAVVSPANVKAGGGIMHNINQVLLPTTNITRLLEITNCSKIV